MYMHVALKKDKRKIIVFFLAEKSSSLFYWTVIRVGIKGKLFLKKK